MRIRRQICRVISHRWHEMRDPWWGSARRCTRCKHSEVLEPGLIPTWWIDILITQMRENVMVQLMGQR
jgi:hypothetical protein